MNIYLWDHPGPPPAYSDMRAALYAQFGEDTPIRIWKHGQRICIFIHTEEESRARFDRRSARVVIRDGAKRTEIENGFHRDAPNPAKSDAHSPSAASAGSLPPDDQIPSPSKAGEDGR